MKAQYSERIDKVIYCEFTSEFEDDDWLGLAEAAMDQAGWTKRESTMRGVDYKEWLIERHNEERKQRGQ